MSFGLCNPVLILLNEFHLCITQFRSHFGTSNMTYGLHKPEVILL